MSVVLHHGECMAGMATLADRSASVTICDPPYSEHVHSRSKRGIIEHEPGTGRAAFNRSRDLGFASLSPESIPAYAHEIARVTQRWSLVFSDTESAHLWRRALEDVGAEYVRTLFWRKVGGTPQFTGDRPAVACEAITLCHPVGRKRWNGGGQQGFYDTPIALDRNGSGSRVHPTQKPLALMEALVRDFTDPGETILDPFAGSGTTLVAAKRLGRNAIGWERDPVFHAAAVKRIEAAREQFVLPGGKRPREKQGAMFGGKP